MIQLAPEPVFVEVLDDGGNIMMLAKGEAVPTGVMKADVRAGGYALTTGSMKEVLVSSAEGAFLDEGAAVAGRLVVVGDWINMSITIEPPRRQARLPGRAPSPAWPFSLCALYVPKTVIRRLGRRAKWLIYWRARRDSNSQPSNP